MGIDVVDHIVLGDARYCSLKEMGQLLDVQRVLVSSTVSRASRAT